MLRLDTDADLIKSDEGYRATVYVDATGKPIGPGSTVIGHPTIGWGIRLDGSGLTVPEAQALIDSRLALARGDASQLLGIGAWSLLGSPRRAALTNMAYTMGRERLSEFTDLLAAIRSSDWPGAKAAVLDSKWAIDEAPARARRIADMLLTGNWPAAA